MGIDAALSQILFNEHFLCARALLSILHILSHLFVPLSKFFNGGISNLHFTVEKLKFQEVK